MVLFEEVERNCAGRPGYGVSTVDPRRTLAEGWPHTSLKRCGAALRGGAACAVRYIRPRRPNTKLTTASIKPTTNRIHAIFADNPATPVSPNTPATNATIKNINAMYNM
jgi:hypothetical protein